ncbi:phage tail tip lysozyme [Eubacterium oxidoreducens]|uniref:NlpC/P60 family protein n=1 Tax=Eubacterium oxidoreducens TaxID=1732 RepID=A0A1G6C3Z0_EUBOX|nr:phage tail tip lysozyme [Eubacterium oxidoreducens]SDB27518.1 NlpC/P60 family protein [Eubacterium oxidoreducens]
MSEQKNDNKAKDLAKGAMKKGAKHLMKKAVKAAGAKVGGVALLSNPVGWVILAVIVAILIVIFVAMGINVVMYELGFDSATDFQNELDSATEEKVITYIDTILDNEENLSEMKDAVGHYQRAGGLVSDAYLGDEESYKNVGFLSSVYGDISSEYNDYMQEIYEEYGIYTIEETNDTGGTTTKNISGFKIDDTEIDTLWEKQEDEHYLASTYFSPIVLSECTSSQYASIADGDVDSLIAVLDEYYESNSIADYSRKLTKKKNSSKTSTETIKRPYYAYVGTGSDLELFGDVSEDEAITKDTKIYVDQIDSEYTILLQGSSSWELRYETVTATNEEADYCLKYTLNLADTTLTSNEDEAEYAYVLDEDTMGALEDLVDSIEDGSIFGTLGNGIKAGFFYLRSKIKDALNWDKIESILSKANISLTSSSSSLISGDGGVGSATGEDAAAWALKAYKNNWQYSNSKRMSKGYVDCSSLCARAYAAAGLDALMSGSSAMVASTQAEYCLKNGTIIAKGRSACKKLKASSLSVGDLIFYERAGAGADRMVSELGVKIGHVAMYIGDGKIIEAKSPSLGIQVGELDLTTDSAYLVARPYQSGDYSSLKSGKSQYKELYEILTSKNGLGLSSAGACGVLGNLYAETTTLNATSGSESTHFGLCQWGGVRMSNLKKYCKKKGYDYKSLEGQVHFMEYEMKKNYPSLVKYLKKTTNATKAAQEFCAVFERPTKNSGSSADYYKGKYYQNLSGRVAWAKKFYEKWGK